MPLLLLRHRYPEFINLTNLTAISGLSLLILTIVFYAGTRQACQDVQFSRYFPLFLVVYMGLSVQNTVAVLQGLFGYRSAFLRTPKFNAYQAASTQYLPQKKNGMQVLEMLALLYFFAGVCLSVYLNDWYFFLLFLMMCVGLGILVFHTWVPQRLRTRLAMPKFSWR